MMHGFQQIVTQAECRYNFVVHGLPPLGDEMRVSPLIWRKKLMDSISGNLGYLPQKNVNNINALKFATKSGGVWFFPGDPPFRTFNFYFPDQPFPPWDTFPN